MSQSRRGFSYVRRCGSGWGKACHASMLSASIQWAYSEAPWMEAESMLA